MSCDQFCQVHPEIWFKQEHQDGFWHCDGYGCCHKCSNNHLAMFVVDAYDLGGTTIKAANSRLNVQSVKAVVTETGTTATTAQGTVLGASIGDSTAEPNSTINGTVPELTAAPSDDTTTTESTETTATPAEQPPTTPIQQHYHAASPQPTAVTHQQKWLEDNAATRLPVKGYYSHHN